MQWFMAGELNLYGSHVCVSGFWNGAVLLTTGVSAGLDIYKQEVGCKDITPDLDDNVKLINQKQRELVEMKDRINLRWVPGKWVSFSSKTNAD